MPKSYHPHERNVPAYSKLTKPVHVTIPGAPAMKSASNKPYEVGFAEQLDSLIYYHLENHESGRHHLQVLQEDSFAKKYIAPKKGMKRSTFFELNNSRGLEQMSYMFNELQIQASEKVLPQYQNLGKLIAVDGSLLDAVLSMYWADYRKGAKKAKVHLGFDINKGIPQKIFLTNGKKGERSFVEKIIAPGQTGILDRGYQCHRNFDQWQESGRHFVCRIKANTHKTVIRQLPLPESSAIFYDAIVLLGKPQINQTQKQLRLVGYEVLGTEYWVATDRLDLSADDIALIYKLRWDIGVSSQGHINQSVKVRPRIKDSNLVAWEAPWRETKMVKPSDKILVKENMQSFRPQRIVNVDVASLHANPVAETVYNVRRQQEPHEMSLIQWFPPAGYQRWHGAKVYVETGEALGIRRRNPVEEANPITLNGKWMSRYQGGGLGRSTNDRCAAKRTSREGPRLMSIPGLICEAGVI